MWVFGVWTAPFDHYSGSMVCPASIALLTTPRSLSAMPLSARECLPAAPQRTEFRSTGTDAPDGGHSPILRVACRYFCRFGRASKAPVLKPAAQERTAFTASVPARRKSSFRLLLGIEPSKGKRRNPFHDRGRAAKGQSCGFFGEFNIALSRVARIRLSQGCNRTREGSAWPIGCLAMKIQE